MTEFTKGPWGTVNIDMANPKFHQIIGPVVCTRPITTPDAHLISAAPDMYEALLELRRQCINSKTMWINMDDVDAAIAKAEGDQC